MIDRIGSGPRDNIAVVDTLTRLAYALDEKDWDGLRPMFADRATAYGAHGIDAIIEHCREHLAGCGPTHHSLTNHIVYIDGPTAEVTSRVRAMHMGRGAFAAMWWECFGTYHDRLALESDRWVVTARAMTVDFALGDRTVLGPG